MSRRVDVLVLGGGPAGIATALTLRRHGLSVCVVEASHYDNLRVGETLPPDIQPLLTQLDLWDGFLALKAVPSYGLHIVWGHDKPIIRDLITNPYGNGWHLDRSAFDRWLWQTAVEQGIEVLTGWKLLHRPYPVGEGWQLVLASSTHRQACYADFVVDATGRSSTLVYQLGHARHIIDHMVGVLSFFNAPSEQLEWATLLEANPIGWWYSAPLPDDRLVVALMTDADLCARFRLKNRPSWEQMLRQSTFTRRRVASCTPQGAIWLAAAHSSMSTPPGQRNWLAVGDAAASYDPLNGIGVYKALHTAIQAGDAIVEARRENFTPLDRYCQRINDDFNAFMKQRAQHYHSVPHWPESPFWQRRHHPGSG